MTPAKYYQFFIKKACEMFEPVPLFRDSTMSHEIYLLNGQFIVMSQKMNNIFIDFRIKTVNGNRDTFSIRLGFREKMLISTSYDKNIYPVNAKNVDNAIADLTKVLKYWLLSIYDECCIIALLMNIPYYDANAPTSERFDNLMRTPMIRVMSKKQKKWHHRNGPWESDAVALT